MNKLRWGALVALASLTLAAPASARRFSPLSEAEATHIGRTYANREGHRIYGLTDIGIETFCWALEYNGGCIMVLKLYYTEDPEVEPTEVRAELGIKKVGPSRCRERLEREWEVEPAS
jgi:hypothetical protein